MRTPTRKPGKYSHLLPDPNMTEAKFRDLQENLKRMKKKQPNMIEEVKRLALMGDFSENAAYQLAKGRLRGLNQRMIDTKKLLSRANIIKPSTNSEIVQLGCHVTIRIVDKEVTYQILGSTETNPNTNIISNNSPLGSSLMEKMIGDTIEIKRAGIITKCEIIRIE